jgi:prepilin-type N-terminal cleavage/methylation domain-containing protein
MTRRRGFTMIEMMIAVVLVGIVMTGALRIFRAVSGSVRTTVERMDAMQNLRFGLSTLDREVRNAGAGITETQPTLVYINSRIVTFNGDLVSTVQGSPTAVFYNPDANAALSNAVTVAQKFTIPTTAVQYPDSTYRTAGALSPAETITFWFESDASTSRTDDFHLMRQVNNGAPEEVARNLLLYPGREFFEWLRTDAAGNLQVVAATALPQRHSNPIHGSLTDTGTVAQIDSIRAVRVNAMATNGLTGSQEIRRTLVTTIRIPNAGLAKQRSCGDTPIFGGTVTAASTGTSLIPMARVSWTPAVDESGGERDVERYLIYRRDAAGAFDEALAAVPAGQASYFYDDATVQSLASYYYGVTALDCTPLESAIRSSGIVNTP